MTAERIARLQEGSIIEITKGEYTSQFELRNKKYPGLETPAMTWVKIDGNQYINDFANCAFTIKNVLHGKEVKIVKEIGE